MGEETVTEGGKKRAAYIHVTIFHLDDSLASLSSGDSLLCEVRESERKTRGTSRIRRSSAHKGPKGGGRDGRTCRLQPSICSLLSLIGSDAFSNEGRKHAHTARSAAAAGEEGRKEEERKSRGKDSKRIIFDTPSHQTDVISSQRARLQRATRATAAAHHILHVGMRMSARQANCCCCALPPPPASSAKSAAPACFLVCLSLA